MGINHLTIPQYIEIDWVDWVGKTTQCMLLNNFLNESWIGSEVIKEVNDYDELSKNIRNLLLKGGFDRKVELFLFLALKAHCFKERAEKNLNENNRVISDRWIPSFLTYNNDIIDQQLSSDLMDMIYMDRHPNLSIILQLEPEELLKRLEIKWGKSRFDTNVDKLFKQQKLLLDMAKHNSQWRIIDGYGSIEDVHDRIKKDILNCL